MKFSINSLIQIISQFIIASRSKKLAKRDWTMLNIGVDKPANDDAISSAA